MVSGRLKGFGLSFVIALNVTDETSSRSYLRSSLEGETANVLYDYGNKVTGLLS